MRYLVLLLLATTASVAQPLSKTQQLASLCKVWGFLKYYHPVVASGQQDWDHRLVELIPAVQQADNQQTLSAVYEDLLNQLGPVKPCRSCQSEPEHTVLGRPGLDLSFLTDSTLFTEPLRSRLTYLVTNRNQGYNYYVQQDKHIKNTSYENEKAYADMAIPDRSHRLLALFRYWNIIHYFFPYKYAIDRTWADVLTSMIPVFEQAETPETYQKAIYQLVASIQDSHGFVTSTDKTRCLRCDLGTLWLPFELKLFDSKAIITRIYSDSLTGPLPVKVGSVISQLDGQFIQSHIARLRPYISASNRLDVLRDLAGLIGVGHDQQARLTVVQNGHDTTVQVSRFPFRKLIPSVYKSVNAQYPVSQWLPDQVGYVNMGKLMSRQVDSVMKPLLRARAIIFDLRNYPNGTFWLVGRYLQTKPAAFARFSGSDLRFPGVFREVGSAKLPTFSRKLERYTGKVIVLVNEETQSQAEFTAMGFRTVPAAVLVGSPTAGADGTISWVPLPGGYRTAFSGIGVYYPDGRETQRVGLIPDVLIRPSIEGLQVGRDEVLERALVLTRGN
ncbi:S41 family peptidase [Fibrella arboris]|uniref:S41 family peptidase n=1 Tax=Fibrella arboris TaxID=3242486 RepID=UPI00352196D0